MLNLNKTKFKKTHMIIKALVGFFASWALLYFVISGDLKDYNNWRHLQDVGIITEGKILEARASPKNSYVTYAFEIGSIDESQTIIKSRERMFLIKFRHLKAEDTISIIYDPLNPSESRMMGNEYPFVMTFISFPYLCIMTFVTLYLLYGSMAYVVRTAKSLFI